MGDVDNPPYDGMPTECPVNSRWAAQKGGQEVADLPASCVGARLGRRGATGRRSELEDRLSFPTLGGF